MKTIIAVVSAFIFGSSSFAKADTVNVFNTTGTFSNSSTLTGTLTIDITSGSILTGDLVSSDLGALLPIPTTQGYNATYGSYDVGFNSPGSSSLGTVLVVNSPTLVGYMGGSLSSLMQPSPNNYVSALFDSSPTGVYSLTSGSLTPDPSVSDAPEPDTWVLLLAGIGGVGMWLRRRTGRRTTVSGLGPVLQG